MFQEIKLTVQMAGCEIKTESPHYSSYVNEQGVQLLPKGTLLHRLNDHCTLYRVYGNFLRWTYPLEGRLLSMFCWTLGDYWKLGNNTLIKEYAGVGLPSFCQTFAQQLEATAYVSRD